MTTAFRAGSALLAITLCSQPAIAQDEAVTIEGDEIVVTPVSLHPAAGLMNEHTHDGGEVMIGLRYARTRSGGTNVRGTKEISDAEILAAGYASRTSSMTMEMVMLDLMYAPDDRLTLMVMPHWMRHEMTMLGIDPANTGGGMHGGGMHGGMAGHHGHSPAFGETMTHAAEGFSDTLVSASYRLAHSPALKAHATLGVWVPTGRVDLQNHDGTFVHYGMQPGSGSWDLEPSLTVSGQSGEMGWGLQASYRWRLEEENASGFAFGDRFALRGWASWRAARDVSLTGRLSFESEGPVTGHYNGPHNHSAPADRQANYGGERIYADIGINYALPFGGPDRPQIGLEAGVPLYQDLNGIQAPDQWRMALSLTKAFR
ncbi:transporter [Paraurantiacibacter namhicola]|uniref:Alpha-amylase n=1 Tax=Paraurantiacibacter namhicola TaxID=645517 RepID=A0A1C7D6L0_9SPHN|nr:transporter [Paraurantiacibacter namhicola]ANU07088.1 hypothetical protein A6F65_00768 [Paraurantiacibacter namhicola]